MLANPVLHPDADHRQLELFHQSVFLIDKLLAANDSNYGTFESPLGKGAHCTHGLGQFLAEGHQVLAVENGAGDSVKMPVKHLGAHGAIEVCDANRGLVKYESSLLVSDVLCGGGV